jgi:hypothetical protein
MTNDTNAAIDDDNEDVRTLPDSDEAIIALMDDNEDMYKYIVELRAEMAKMREELDKLKQTP